VRPALVILAAGASERLGAPKALAEIDGQRALARLCEAGRGVDGGRALAVLGRHAAEIAPHLPAGCTGLDNPHWAAGRSGGVLLAHRALPGRALLLAPVDVPLVPARVFEALAAEWERLGDPELGWLAPRLAGERPGAYGHPVVVGPLLLEALEGLPADTPLRELRSRARPLAALEVFDPEILDDLDTRADLERLRNRRPIRP
jgi:CTP:molybdopterin cytidylyltransferase MocA